MAYFRVFLPFVRNPKIFLQCEFISHFGYARFAKVPSELFYMYLVEGFQNISESSSDILTEAFQTQPSSAIIMSER